MLTRSCASVAVAKSHEEEFHAAPDAGMTRATSCRPLLKQLQCTGLGYVWQAHCCLACNMIKQTAASVCRPSCW